MSSWIFLSYPWGPSCPSYAGGARIEVQKVRCMDHGDPCNAIEFKAPNHIGTHFDFPLHFHEKGKGVLDYSAQDFVFESVLSLWFECEKGSLIAVEDLKKALSKYHGNYEETLICIRSGASLYRDTEDFWKNGTGIDVGVGNFLRETFPKLRCVALDSISISSLQHRDIGRRVHKEFLCDEQRPLWIIEDLNLESVKDLKIKKLIALPLRIEGGDGAPCTVIANL